MEEVEYLSSALDALRDSYGDDYDEMYQENVDILESIIFKVNK